LYLDRAFDAIKAGGNELKKNKLGRGGAFTQNGCRFDLNKIKPFGQKKKEKKEKKRKFSM
jgi:hypothetical protein